MRITDHEFNRLRILQVLRHPDPVSRTELSRLTGLSSGSMSELVTDLIQEGLVFEERKPGPGRGRPRMQLTINPEAAYAVGGYHSADSMVVDIVDLRGNLVFRHTVPLPMLETVEALAESYAETIRDCIALSGVDRTKLRRVGLALAGIIDSKNGVLHWMYHMPDRPVPVAAIVERALGVPVTLDNTANVTARGEHWFGSRLNDFSLVAVGLGIGFARYVDGALMSGANGMNPEFSHVKVIAEGGRQCYCGGHGCLAAYSTIYGLLEQASEIRGVPMQAVPDLDAVFDALLDEPRDAQSPINGLLHTAAQMLGMSVASHINMADPGVVLIKWTSARLAEALTEPTRRAIAEHVLPPLRQTPVLFEHSGAENYGQGMAALVLEQLYRKT